MEDLNDEIEIVLIIIILILRHAFFLNYVVTIMPLLGRLKKRKRSTNRLKYSMTTRLPKQINHLDRIISENDTACIDNTRLSRNALGKLVYLLSTVSGLTHSKNVRLEEKVTMFLSIVAHHKKMRIVGHDFIRSGETVNKYFHEVLSGILRLHPILLAKPTPVPEDSDNFRLKHFKGCLGALDGTYIKVKVNVVDHGRYRTRKKEIAVNVLFVCDFSMKYVYVMTGWEGSAADSRVLRAAVNKENGFRVPIGHYYLCDNGYANSEGFLTPYKSTRYHLKEWGSGRLAPQTPQEYFNMKHSSARNVVERSFALFKNRWKIFSSQSFYAINVQNEIIMACALLHNFCLMEMPHDSIPDTGDVPEVEDEHDQVEYIDIIDPTDEWAAWREVKANTMWANRDQVGRGSGSGSGSGRSHGCGRGRGRGTGRGSVLGLGRNSGRGFIPVGRGLGRGRG